METIPQLRPQVITIFVPDFKRKKVKLRQLIMSDNWVADCEELDEKYGVWYTTIEQAQIVLNIVPKTEF